MMVFVMKWTLIDDNDGLIEIQTLAQLHAIRTDLDGDGRTDAGVVARPESSR